MSGGVAASLRVLVGDALIAVGEAIRPDYARDRDRARPLQSFEPIPRSEARAALDELTDSHLLNIAATVIAGWTPILLKSTSGLTDVSVLIDALRDRASQFAALDYDPAPARYH